MNSLKQIRFQTRGGLQVRRTSIVEDYSSSMGQLTRELDVHRGLLLSSSFEYPGRYTRWDIGFVNPPLQIVARDREVCIEALNDRGTVLLPAIYTALSANTVARNLQHDRRVITLQVPPSQAAFAEEQRSRQPSVFSILRTLVALFFSASDDYLGLYGAFGYDLGFQFEDVRRFHSRPDDHRDLVLYLPDRILVADHRLKETNCLHYEFVCPGWKSAELSETTGGLQRRGSTLPYVPAIGVTRSGDHRPGEYADSVRRAIGEFRRGNLFEVVPGQVFYEPCRDNPSAVFSRLRENNPAPYGALVNLGNGEYLVAASPEMFVRTEGRKIETCPISGTIKRGEDAIADARQIRALLNSAKDEAELSMCTDVDRNDKARVCIPGSVTVEGRRQVEMYSRLIHTVDHVTGTLAPEFDALDGFLAHTWAVTVTGAPKLAAMQFIEKHEKSLRGWYGGALGCIGFNGNLNTGLTLRTIHIKDGVAEIRAGATLLIDSDPESEEAETRLKASALLDAVTGKSQSLRTRPGAVQNKIHSCRQFQGLRTLMVDHQDSFVHNLAAYFRQCGAQVTTLRPEYARSEIESGDFDLIVLSPGPGRPGDYAVHETLRRCIEKQLPVFGVCLGLQGVVEYFGGKLGQLDKPMHGQSSPIVNSGGMVLQGLSPRLEVGRYHSLYACEVPDCLEVVARSEDGTPMAVEHKHLPVSAVQFHPESLMTLGNCAGLMMVANVVNYAGTIKLNRRTG